MKTKLYLLALLTVAAMVLAACPAPVQPAPPAAPAAEQPAAQVEQPAAPAAEPVTIQWWHITTAENQKAVWQKLADEYMAAHPNVTIEITVLENEAFKTKMTTTM